jgi:2-iminoacetate synthase ThiH
VQACDFCGFARDKTPIGSAKYLDVAAFSRALPILYRRGIRFMTLRNAASRWFIPMSCVSSR